MLNNKHLYKIFFSVMFFAILSVDFSHLAHAQNTYNYQPLATIPLGNGGTNLTTSGQNVDPATYVSGLYTLAFGIAIIIAVVSGVWAGIEWMLGGDNPSKISSAKNRLQNVGWGFLLLLCSYTILYIINPQLVTFNLDLGSVNAGAQISAEEAEQKATQAAINALATTANNAVIQSQSDAAAAATAAQALASCLAANNNNAANCATQQTAANQTQTTSTQSAEKTTVTQANLMVSSDITQITTDLNSNNGNAVADLQKFQSDYNAALTKLQQEQVAASNAGNVALANQITKDGIALVSSITQKYGCTPSQLQVSNQQLQLNNTASYGGNQTIGCSQ